VHTDRYTPHRVQIVWARNAGSGGQNVRQLERVVQDGRHRHAPRTAPRRQLASQQQYALSLLYVRDLVSFTRRSFRRNVLFFRLVTCNELA